VDLLADESHEGPARHLVENWYRHLGVEINLLLVSPEDFPDLVEGEQPNIFIDTWNADYPDPDSFLRLSTAVTWTGWTSRAFGHLMRRARLIADLSQRAEAYQLAEQVLIADAPVIPLAYGRNHLLVRPYIRQFPSSPQKWWYWKDVILDNEQDNN